MVRKAIINGVNGQDGAYLSKHLLEQGVEVYGGVRSNELSGLENLESLGLLGQIELFELGLSDQKRIDSLIASIAPNEFYNLAALSSVSKSWDYPEETFDVNATGVLRILQSLKNRLPQCKFFQASSSEMFGDTSDPFQNEETRFCPTNPYGISKLAAYHAVRSYRESCALFACNGILFNHESPLRPENYVSRKITKALAKISSGRTEILKLGNLDVERDWGYAPEYVRGMAQMLQYEEPLDLVFATGESHSIRTFVEIASKHIGIELVWEGSGYNEVGRNKATGAKIVVVDENFYRPIDIKQTRGNSAKAKATIGWAAAVRVEELAAKMIDHDILELKQDMKRH